MLAHDETKGYALISGGQPSIRTDSGCITGDGVNDSGLWIFLRTRERNDSLIEEVREVARKFEIDLSVLNDVDQTNCSHGENLAKNWVARNAPLDGQLARSELWLIEEELDGMSLNREQLLFYNTEILCHNQQPRLPITHVHKTLMNSLPDVLHHDVRVM